MQFGQLFPYIALTPFITFPLLPAASLILASLEFPLHSLEWHTSSSQVHIFYQGVNGRKTEAFPRMMMARSFWGHVSRMESSCRPYSETIWAARHGRSVSCQVSMIRVLWQSIVQESNLLEFVHFESRKKRILCSFRKYPQGCWARFRAERG